MFKPKVKVVLATTNAGKLSELQTALTQPRLMLHGLDEFPDAKEVDETGLTFPENASLKAIGYALQLGLPTLADDSGLEIDALGGQPGVHSARFGGDVPYQRKIEMLLEELRFAPVYSRTARFRCSIALADARGEIIKIVEGSCDGSIAALPRGDCGFGYDPIFIPNGYDQTFGELDDRIKRSVSHRANAVEAIKPYLRDFIAVST